MNRRSQTSGLSPQQRAFTTRVAMLAALVASGVAIVALQPGSAMAYATGTVGTHDVGSFECNPFSGQMSFSAPSLFAVNARYGIYNDYQHVSWTVFLYKEDPSHPGTFWSTGWRSGSWASWGFGGRVAYDAYYPALTGGGVITADITSRGRYAFIVSESWYDSPTPSYGSATHNVVTGNVVEFAGTCSF